MRFFLSETNEENMIEENMVEDDIENNSEKKADYSNIEKSKNIKNLNELAAFMIIVMILVFVCFETFFFHVSAVSFIFWTDAGYLMARVQE